MNNTKTIFKSLLIMIVAISLFTVSCSKDEGTPTTPAKPITITAESITSAFKGLGTITIGGQDFDFSNFDGKATEITGTANADSVGITTVEQLKNGIKNISVRGATVSGPKEVFDVSSGADTKTITITITPAGDNRFGSIDTTTLTAIKLNSTTSPMTVEVTLKFKPNGNWKVN